MHPRDYHCMTRFQVVFEKNCTSLPHTHFHFVTFRHSSSSQFLMFLFQFLTYSLTRSLNWLNWFKSLLRFLSYLLVCELDKYIPCQFWKKSSHSSGSVAQTRKNHSKSEAGSTNCNGLTVAPHAWYCFASLTGEHHALWTFIMPWPEHDKHPPCMMHLIKFGIYDHLAGVLAMQ